MGIKQPPLQEKMDNGTGRFRQVWALWFDSIKYFLRCIFVSNDCNIGIGVEEPTATLHIKAGTTTNPPLKFESGTLLTSSEAGAVEYDGNHFYMSTLDGIKYAVTLSNSALLTTTTLTNTATETTIYSKTFAANEIHAGKILEVFSSGVVTNASGTDDFTFRLYLNGSLVHTLRRVGNNVNNVGWDGKIRLTCRSDGASGEIMDFISYSESGLSPQSDSTLTPHIIDTTTSNTISVTMQWDNAKAGNVFSITQAYLQISH